MCGIMFVLRGIFACVMCILFCLCYVQFYACGLDSDDPIESFWQATTISFAEYMVHHVAMCHCKLAFQI